MPLQPRQSISPLLIGIALLFSRCHSRDRAGQERVEMQFSVDSALVNRELNDSSLSITFRVPGGWKDLTGDSVISKQFVQEDSTGRIRLSRILQNDRVFFSITDVQKMPDSSFRMLREKPEQALNANHKWTRVDTATYYKDSFLVRQYLMTGTGLSDFKLLFYREAHPLFQVDFLLPADSSYADRTKIFESIIGSIKRKG